jgi:ribokinase
MSEKKDVKKILVFGDVNVDIIARVKSWPRPGEECLAEHVELHCGGVGANCALALRRWGIPAGLVASVGRDAFGEFALEKLAENGVDVRGVQRTAEATTGLLYINVTPDGQRTFFGSRGANRFAKPPKTKPSLWKRANAACLVGYSFLDRGPELAAEQILEAVHTRGGWVSLDVGIEPSQKIPNKILRMAKRVDLVLVSSQEAAALTGIRDARAAFHALQRTGAREVVMKLGRHGCFITENGVVRRVPAFAVRAVDSTGAGDAFTAAFLQARLRGWPLAEAALAANAAGAVAAGVVGAGEKAPGKGEIANLARARRLKPPWDAVRLRVLRRLQ